MSFIKAFFGCATNQNRGPISIGDKVFIRVVDQVRDRSFLPSFVYLLSLGVATVDLLNLLDKDYQISPSMTQFGVLQVIALLLSCVVFYFYVQHRVSQVVISLAVLIVVADTIVFFAELYKKFGLISVCKEDLFGYLYFSIITWTTVGFGDISPNKITRVYAAIEPIIAYFAMVLIFTLALKLFIEENKTPSSDIVGGYIRV